MHGTVRHLDTHIVERPVVERPGALNRDVRIRPPIIVDRDANVDVRPPRFWYGFVFGKQVPILRAGNLRIVVDNVPYFYDDGIFYQQVDNVYQEVYAPIGASVPQAPEGSFAVEAGNLVYYYAGGAFYVRQGANYIVAPAPIGVVVPDLPPGAVQVAIQNGVAYQFNGVYYQPVFADGVTQYMTFTP